MKKAIYSLGILCMVLSIDAKSQDNKPANTPTKGYYSIGSNATKLSLQNQSAVSATEVAVYPTVTKGYYAAGTNNQKLGRKVIQGGEPVQSKPAVTKGYYSIGRNAAKL